MEGVKDASRSIFQAFGDHDWTRAVGVDVLLSAMFLSLWVFRNHNAKPQNMLTCTTNLRFDELAKLRREQMEDRSMEEVEDALVDPMVFDRKTSKDMKRRVSSSQANIGLSDNDIEREQPAIKRRGRPARIPTPSTSSGRVYQNQTRSTSRSSARSRSRPRASVSPVKRSTSRRPSSRIADVNDTRYMSDFGADEERTHAMHKLDAEMRAEDAESVGLTWFFFAIGGLGLASSAVYGASLI